MDRTDIMVRDHIRAESERVGVNPFSMMYAKTYLNTYKEGIQAQIDRCAYFLQFFDIEPDGIVCWDLHFSSSERNRYGVRAMVSFEMGEVHFIFPEVANENGLPASDELSMPHSDHKQFLENWKRIFDTVYGEAS